MSEQKTLQNVLFLLIFLTLASTALTMNVLVPHHESFWSILVFAIGIIKAKLVVFYFMELKRNTISMKFDACLLIFGAIYFFNFVGISI